MSTPNPPANPRPDKGVSQQGVKNPSKRPDLRGEAKKYIVKTIAAGLVSLGVPPKLADALSPYILKAFIVLLSFIFIVLVAVVADPDGGDVKATPAYEQLGSQQRLLIEDISAKENIPSRIVAAIALAQTQFGTLSPYPADNVARDGGSGSSNYPVVQPAIGSPDIAGQGLGPYLLRIDAVRDSGIDPQSWRKSTEIIVSLMVRERDNLIRAGLKEPESFEEADAFWAKVVSELPLVDPLTGDAGCTADPGDIGNAIIAIWKCEIRRSGVQLYQVNETLGVTRTSRISSRETVNTLVQDALAVAWTWGSRNGAKEWSEIAASPCSDSSVQAGVFPLTKSIAKRYDLVSRCDVIGNIKATAQLVIADLSTTPESKPEKPYLAMAQGWRSLGLDVFGANTAREKFLTSGPWRPYQPKNECSILVANWVAQLSSSPVASIFADAAPAEASTSKALELFDAEVGGAPRRDPRCIDQVTGDLPLLDVFLTYVADAATAQLTELNEGAAGTTASSSIVLEGLINVALQNGASAFVPVTQWGVSSSIPRLSPSEIEASYPFIQPVESGSLPIGLAQRVIGLAIVLGGILGDDDRAGQNPYGGFSGDVFGSALGIGIAVDREDPNQKTVIPAVSSLVTSLSCGSNGESRYALPAMAQRWETMCNAAKSDGVDIGIISAWRSQADQQRLYDAYKNSPNARVARPGFSPHQKGQAIDVNLGSPDGVNRNAGRSYAWLHTIVGCYDSKNKTFQVLGRALLNTEYAAEIDAGSSPCSQGQLPVKRMQTYGVVPLCTLNSQGKYESLSSREVILCDSTTIIVGSASRQSREPWHLDVGIISASSPAVVANNIEGCSTPPAIDPESQRSVAVGVKTLWYCELAKNGFTAIPPRDGPGQYKPTTWFDNFAEQIASEAVLVAYCESRLRPANASGSYKGVFQINDTEMRAGGMDARLWSDANANITAAARLWLQLYKTANPYEGWSRWATVNTEKYLPGASSIKIPVIGRFMAVPNSPRAGEISGMPLPNWVIDPTSYWGGLGDCASSLGEGKPMKDAPSSTYTP
jgi:hypothetical protein